MTPADRCSDCELHMRVVVSGKCIHRWHADYLQVKREVERLSKSAEQRHDRCVVLKRERDDAIEGRAAREQELDHERQVICDLIVERDEALDKLSLADDATCSEAEARDSAEGKLKGLGDAAADVIQQMLRGKWRDDHDHDVQLNAGMIELKDALRVAIPRRALVDERETK